MNNNEIKLSVIEDLSAMLLSMNSKLKVLRALDEDSTESGCYDLHDQLMTLENGSANLYKALRRAKSVVPSK
jgi:hypothetical protein